MQAAPQQPAAGQPQQPPVPPQPQPAVALQEQRAAVAKLLPTSALRRAMSAAGCPSAQRRVNALGVKTHIAPAVADFLLAIFACLASVLTLKCETLAESCSKSAENAVADQQVVTDAAEVPKIKRVAGIKYNLAVRGISDKDAQKKALKRKDLESLLVTNITTDSVPGRYTKSSKAKAVMVSADDVVQAVALLASSLQHDADSAFVWSLALVLIGSLPLEGGEELRKQHEVQLSFLSARAEEMATSPGLDTKQTTHDLEQLRFESTAVWLRRFEIARRCAAAGKRPPPAVGAYALLREFTAAVPKLGQATGISVVMGEAARSALRGKIPSISVMHLADPKLAFTDVALDLVSLATELLAADLAWSAFSLAAVKRAPGVLYSRVVVTEVHFAAARRRVSLYSALSEFVQDPSARMSPTPHFAKRCCVGKSQRWCDSSAVCPV